MSDNDKPLVLKQELVRDGSESSIAFLFSVDNPNLTQDQTNHIARLGKEFCFAMQQKYVAGAREHKGDLHDLSIDALLNNAIEEAIDQVVYLLTLRENLHANYAPKPSFIK